MKKFLLLLFCSIPYFWALPTYAAIAVEEIQPLKFGDMVITGAAPQRLLIEPDGTETPLDGGITKLSPKGQAGIAKLSGFTPSANVTVTLSAPEITQALKAGSSAFDITDFTLDSVSGTYTADPDGFVFVKVGATLTTTGAAGTYSDGAYRGLYTLDLLIDY